MGYRDGILYEVEIDRRSRDDTWVCNPIHGDTVLRWRERRASPWEVHELPPNGRLPRHVMKAMGMIYEDGIYGDE